MRHGLIEGYVHIFCTLLRSFYFKDVLDEEFL